MNEVPVTVIGGYLGAGKTSLINHLLRNAGGRRLAVMVNDFGQVNIDADLIEDCDGDVVRLAGGCVCCAFGPDLVRALESLLQGSAVPDHVLIEASGVGMPGSIALTAVASGKASVAGTVVVVDARSIQDRWYDKYVGDTVQRQCSEADRIVLNHCDGLSADEVVERLDWIERHASGAVVFPTSASRAPMEFVLDRRATAISPGAGSSVAPPSLLASKPMQHPFETDAFRGDGPVDVHGLARALTRLEPALARAKGILRDRDGSLVTLQVVGAESRVERCRSVRTSTPVVCVGVRGLYDRPIIAAVFAQYGLH